MTDTSDLELIKTRGKEIERERFGLLRSFDDLKRKEASLDQETVELNDAERTLLRLRRITTSSGEFELLRRRRQQIEQERAEARSSHDALVAHQQALEDESSELVISERTLRRLHRDGPVSTRSPAINIPAEDLPASQPVSARPAPAAAPVVARPLELIGDQPLPMSEQALRRMPVADMRALPAAIRRGESATLNEIIGDYIIDMPNKLSQ